MAKVPTFLREATGLVRTFSWYDALILSLAVTGPTLFGISSQEGYVYPNGIGANLTTAAIIGFFFMIPLGLAYYIFSTQMPRSGGDYIWLGRSLHPVLGFIGGWAMFLSFVLLLASAMTTEAYVVIPNVAVSLGYAWSSPGLVTWGQNFVSGSASAVNLVVFGTTMISILISIAIISFGPRLYSRIMILLGIIIFLATFIFIGGYLFATPSSFAAGLSSMTNGGTTVSGTIAQATSSGAAFVPITLGATLFAVPFGVLLFNGFNYSAYIGGEVKNPKRSQLWGILIALAICGVLDITGIYAVLRAQTYPFAQAAFALAGAGKFSLGVTPWAPVFIGAVVGNPYLDSIVAFGFLIFNIWWAAGLLLTATRYVFAFSFDRIFPTAFADINPRFHFPLKATVLTLALAAVFTYVTIYTSYFSQLVNVVTIWTIVWIMVGISAIVLPFWKKNLAQGLPGGGYLLPVFGGLTIIGMGATFYWSATIPAIGAVGPFASAFIVAIFALAVVIYAVRYYYFKGKGVDITTTLKEIPPE